MRQFLTLKDFNSSQSAFVLPSVLLISISLLIIGLSLVQSGSSIRNALNDQYYNRLASEAAQAGTTYANYCLTQSTYSQLWGPINAKPNLTQTTSCDGSARSNPVNTLVSESNIRSRFEVGDLESRRRIVYA